MSTTPDVPAPTIEFIFHGTGTSSSVPNVACLTADPITCETCGSTLAPHGQKNKRRNTGGILRIPSSDEQPERVIVIDVGKTFLAAALDLFPRYGLRRIDAVLLTHPHADGWTLRGSIQDHIDIYASAFTFREVQRSFPYLVAKEFATGGGDIPEFRWHIIRENEPFKVEGVDMDITPIAVHHGRLFTNDETGPPGFAPTPNDTPVQSRTATPSKSFLGLSSTRLQGGATHSRHGSVESLELRPSPLGPLANHQSRPADNPQAPVATSHSHDLPAKPKPYLCFGFIIGDFMVYISDVSHIPQEAWQTIEQSIPAESKELSEKMKSLSINGAAKTRPKTFKLLVVDCLKLEAHTSHFGIEEAVATAKRLNVARTYMVGFGHGIPHWDWVTIGRKLEGNKITEAEAERPHVKKALQMVSSKEGEGIWIQPAHDGLRVFANETEVWEKEA